MLAKPVAIGEVGWEVGAAELFSVSCIALCRPGERTRRARGGATGGLARWGG